MPARNKPIRSIDDLHGDDLNHLLHLVKLCRKNHIALHIVPTAGIPNITIEEGAYDHHAAKPTPYHRLSAHPIIKAELLTLLKSGIGDAVWTFKDNVTAWSIGFYEVCRQRGILRQAPDCSERKDALYKEAQAALNASELAEIRSDLHAWEHHTKRFLDLLEQADAADRE